MAPLPPNLPLRAGERVCAVIEQNRLVLILRDALFAVLGLMVAVAGTIALDISLARDTLGLGSGLVTTLVFLFGPLLSQRLFGARPPYVVTEARLILAEDDVITLRDIRKIRVWATSVSLTTDARKVTLSNLINPPAVARLIRDILAAQRSLSV